MERKFDTGTKNHKKKRERGKDRGNKDSDDKKGF